MTVRAPGHPLTTLLFVAASIYVIIGFVTSNPGNAIRGCVLLGLGWPAFHWWRRTATVTTRPD